MPKFVTMKRSACFAGPRKAPTPTLIPLYSTPILQPSKPILPIHRELPRHPALNFSWNQSSKLEAPQGSMSIRTHGRAAPPTSSEISRALSCGRLNNDGDEIGDIVCCPSNTSQRSQLEGDKLLKQGPSGRLTGRARAQDTMPMNSIKSLDPVFRTSIRVGFNTGYTIPMK